MSAQSDLSASEASLASWKQTRTRGRFAEVRNLANKGDLLLLVWRPPAPPHSVWRTWRGTVLARLAEGDLSVLWEGPEAPPTAVVFPPASPLRVRDITLETPPPPLAKRPREDAEVTSGWSPQHLGAILEAQADVACGVRKPCVSLVPGLRIPAFIAETEAWLWPQRTSDVLATMRSKLLEYQVTFPSGLTRYTWELDLRAFAAAISDISNNHQKEDFYLSFHLNFRVLSTIVKYSSLIHNGQTAADKFVATMRTSWDEGRCECGAEFLAIFANASTSAPAAPAALPAPPLDPVIKAVERLKSDMTSAIASISKSNDDEFRISTGSSSTQRGRNSRNHPTKTKNWRTHRFKTKRK